MPSSAPSTPPLAVVHDKRCASPSVPTDAPVPTQAAVRRTETIFEVRRSALVAPIRCVIRSLAELDSTSREFHQAFQEIPRDIDFSRSVIVIAALGERPDESYWIVADTTWIQGDTSVVVVRSGGATDEGQVAGDMFVYPLIAVLVPRSREVAFIERE